MAGKKGRSGRHPSELTLACQSAFTKYQLVQEAVRIAQHGKDADKLNALKFLAAYAYGQPSQPVIHEGEVDLNVQEHRHTFTSRMDRLTERLGAAAFPEFPE